MAEKQALWVESFPIYDVPAYVCPRCGQGTLRIAKETLHEARTGDSRAFFAAEEFYDPVLDEGRFIFLMHCSRDVCLEPVAVVGRTSNQPYWIDAKLEHDTYYHPQCIIPGPPLAIMPPATPAPVVEAMKQAFSLFWTDLGAAANKLRVAAERVLNQQGVAQYPRKGKRRAIPLSNRIEAYAKTNAQHEDFLRLLQWLGNEGSHKGTLDRGDLLIAFEMMQLGLQDIYGVNYRKELTRKAREIVARRGKPRRKPRAA